MAIVELHPNTEPSALGASQLVLLALLAQLRDQARSEHGTSEIAGWAHAIDEQVLLLIENEQLGSARRVMQERLGLRVDKD